MWLARFKRKLIFILTNSPLYVAKHSIRRLRTLGQVREDLLTIKVSFLDESDSERWHRIHGWVLPDAAEKLYHFAKACGDEGAVVEIGSYSGKSTICIARGVRDSKRADKRVHAFDMGFQPDFYVNLRRLGVDGLVTATERLSIAAANSWNAPIGFLFIDGDHEQWGGYADFMVWEKFVVVGGIIALDDTWGLYIGPLLQVQVALAHGAYEKLVEVGGVTFLKKIRQLGDVITVYPLSEPVRRSLIAVSSTTMGAMDLELRVPLHEDIPEMPPGIVDAFTRGLEPLVRDRGAPEADQLTIRYLDAVRNVHGGDWKRAAELFRSLADAGPDAEFTHYQLPIASLARLRLAQVFDLEGKRDEAKAIFRQLAEESKIPELAEGVSRWLERAYQIPAVSHHLSAREFAIRSPLYKYHRY